MEIKRRNKTTAEVSKKFRDCSGVFSFQTADQINFVCIRSCAQAHGRRSMCDWKVFLAMMIVVDGARLLRSEFGIALLLRWNFRSFQFVEQNELQTNAKRR